MVNCLFIFGRRRHSLGLGRCPISMVRSGGIDRNLLDSLSNLEVSVVLQCLHFRGRSLAFIECFILVITQPMTPRMHVEVNVFRKDGSKMVFCICHCINQVSGDIG